MAWQASVRCGRSPRRSRRDSQRSRRALSVSPRISFWVQKRVPSGRRASSSTATIPGWSSLAVSRTSRRKRARAAAVLGVVAVVVAVSSLSATTRPTNSSSARHTTDCPPRPSSSSRVYWPSRSGGTMRACSDVNDCSPSTGGPNVRATAAPPPSVSRTRLASPLEAASASLAIASSSSRRSAERTPELSSRLSNEGPSGLMSLDDAASITCAGVTKPAWVARTPRMRFSILHAQRRLNASGSIA